MSAECRTTDGLVNHPWSFILKGNDIDKGEPKDRETT